MHQFQDSTASSTTVLKEKEHASMQLNFTAVTESDFPTIETWISEDYFFWDKTKPAYLPSWWAKFSYVSFKIQDAQGTVIFCRFDRENATTLRMHSQFAPSARVSERRVAAVILEAIPRFVKQAAMDGFTAIVFDSVSPKLTKFMCDKLGFEPIGNNDYQLSFGFKRTDSPSAAVTEAL
jgi:hypothetical protein